MRERFWPKGLVVAQTDYAPRHIAAEHRTRAAFDQDPAVLSRIPAELHEKIVNGRSALAESNFKSNSNSNSILSSISNSVRREELLRENGPVAQLLALLWHTDPEVRRAAVYALPGGDRLQAHIIHYGHFVGAFLRGLSDVNARHNDVLPANAADRYDRVAAVLHTMLDQNIGEIRGMSNMNYSFLSSALYMAVLSTSLDVVCAMRRLRATRTQAELCRLLWNLEQMNVLRCLNSQDLAALAAEAGKALAAMPPDQIPDFWHSLSHTQVARRQAVAQALSHFQNRDSVPFLLDALNVPGGQPGWLGQQIVAGLGRLEDVRALPALALLASGSDRKLRDHARAASAAIQRATRRLPSQTLLRAAQETDGWDSETMLRTIPVNSHEREPSCELLRTSQPARDCYHE